MTKHHFMQTSDEYYNRDRLFERNSKGKKIGISLVPLFIILVFVGFYLIAKSLDFVRSTDQPTTDQNKA